MHQVLQGKPGGPIVLMIPLSKVCAFLVACCLGTSAVVAGSASADSPNAAPQRALDVGASNMGFCSAFLGQLQVRDDVNRIIVENFPVSPGSLFRERAKQEANAPTPAQECLQRQ